MSKKSFTMSKKSFTMRLSDEDRKLLTDQAEQEGRTRTAQFLWLLKRRQKDLDAGRND